MRIANITPYSYNSRSKLNFKSEQEDKSVSQIPLSDNRRVLSQKEISLNSMLASVPAYSAAMLGFVVASQSGPMYEGITNHRDVAEVVDYQLNLKRMVDGMGDGDKIRKLSDNTYEIETINEKGIAKYILTKNNDEIILEGSAKVYSDTKNRAKDWNFVCEIGQDSNVKSLHIENEDKTESYDMNMEDEDITIIDIDGKDIFDRSGKDFISKSMLAILFLISPVFCFAKGIQTEKIVSDKLNKRNREIRGF